LLLFSHKIKFFAQNSEIVHDRVCMAQDVKLKGVSSRARKTGDIAGIRTKAIFGQSLLKQRTPPLQNI